MYCVPEDGKQDKVCVCMCVCKLETCSFTTKSFSLQASRRETFFLRNHWIVIKIRIFNMLFIYGIIRSSWKDSLFLYWDQSFFQGPCFSSLGNDSRKPRSKFWMHSLLLTVPWFYILSVDKAEEYLPTMFSLTSLIF